MEILPTPQSRIEELMKAFITRDMTCLSQPQSRIEEYWHNMIEGTNIMPIPQSRVEALLKKIIENDTNEIPHAQSRIEEFLISILTGEIDNLPIPQSRSELYLDYIARNNRPVEDIEYVSYSGTNITAHNTIEKPIKSAILKGQTLVNLVPEKIIDYTASSDWDGYHQLVQNSKQSFDEWRALQDLKPNTKYYISCHVETFEVVNDEGYRLNNPSVESIFEDSMIVNGVGRYQWVSTTKSELTDEIFMALRCQNAFARGAIKIRDIMIIEYQDGMENWDIPYFEGMQSVKMPVLTTSNEDGTKTNILTVNEPIELRGIGDVKDELNLLTGEVVERTGEIVLNGNESWWFADGPDNPESTGTWTHSENTWLLGVDFTTISSNTHPVKNTISDKYPVYYNYSFSDSEYFNILSDNNALLFRVRKDRFSDKSIVNFKSWLSQNPITIQYQLTTESVKTVDLSVVNQDENKVNKVSAFNDITHIISSSDEPDSLIAEATVEVPTKLPESLINAKELGVNVE